MKVFLDVGAWVGSSADFVRRTYGDDVKIYSFEPDERNLYWLNLLDDIEIVPCAVGRSDEYTVLRTGRNSVSSSMIKEKKIRGDIVEKKVKKINFSRWIKENLQKEDYIICKLNAEGAEYEIVDALIKDDTIFWIDELLVDWHYAKIGMSEEKHAHFLGRIPIPHSGWGYNPSRKVCYTVATGPKVKLTPVLSQAVGWDYICFTNNANIEPKGWEIRHIKESKEDDKYLSRKVKILHDRYLPGCHRSVYIDTRFTPIASIDHFVNKRLKCDFSVMDHKKRDCVYDEITYLREKLGYDCTKQREKYMSEGMPMHFGLWSPGIMLRKHRSVALEKFCTLWWEEVKAGSHRDMISLAYCMWRYGHTISHRVMDFRRTYGEFMNHENKRS